MSNLWRCLEETPGLVAVADGWRQRAGLNYEGLRSAFLSETGRESDSFPSAHVCQCRLRVVRHPDGSIVGVSDCGSVGCKDVSLARRNLALLAVSWLKLRQAVASAFDCDAKDMDWGLPGTRQIASLGGTSLPVVMTIQHDATAFRSLVGQLVARLPRPFILLAPTSRFILKPAVGRFAIWYK